jgi:hypothetical protein
MFLSRCGLFHTVERFGRLRKLKVKIVSDLFWADFGLAGAFRVEKRRNSCFLAA